MAHVMKCTASASGHMFSHYARSEEKERSKDVVRSNEKINPEKTCKNYNLAPDRGMTQLEFLHKRLSEIKVQKRADVNVFCDWVITLPKSIRCMYKDIHLSPNEEMISRLFFERVYKFLVEKYGEENVISAFVHRDETRDHLHFAFVPAVPDKKWNEKHPEQPREKLSAKEALTRNDLKKFHIELERYLDSFHDWHFEVINDATKDGNKTIAEQKKQQAHEDILTAQREAENARQMAFMEVERTKALEKQKKALEGQIQSLQEQTYILTSKEVADLKGEKTLRGGLKGVSFREYEALKRTASQVDTMRSECDQALRIASEANERARTAEFERSNAYADAFAVANKKLQEKIREVEQDRPSLKMSQENARLQRENDSLKKLLDLVTQQLENHFPAAYRMVIESIQKKKNQSRTEPEHSASGRSRSSGRER